jgi:hypothetical protein
MTAATPRAHDLIADSERAVVADLLQRPELLPDVVAAGLAPVHFATKPLATIYAAMLSLDEDGVAIAGESVTKRLDDGRTLAGVGGPFVLAELMDEPCSQAAAWHAKRVAEQGQLRVLASAAQRVLHDPGDLQAQAALRRALEDPPRALKPVDLASVSFSGEGLLSLLARPKPLPVEAARPVPGHFSTLIAPPMVGKSTLALWNAMARAAGVAPWPGAEARPYGGVLIYSLDEAPEQVARRMNGLAFFHPAGRLEHYADRITVIGPDRELDPVALEPLRFNETGLATLARWLDKADRAGQPFAEVYIDAYADVIPAGETENSNEEATRIGGALERLAVRFGCAIVLLHHTGKPKAEAGEEVDVRWLGRGASALAAKARCVTSLELVAGLPHLRRVRTATNLGPAPRPALFEVCSENAAADELIYFKPTADPTERDPRDLLSPGETITTRDLARRLAGDSLGEDAEPPGDLKRAAAALRERWRAAGKVIVGHGLRGAKTLRLVDEKEAK